MTRVLSELLGAKEPNFRQDITRLERASGSPSNDIKLSTRVNAVSMDKIRQLGLAPRDTTAQELYHALMEKAKRDDQQLRSLLGEIAAGNISARVRRLVESLDIPRQTFAIKNAVLKKIIRDHPPKKALSSLGYRSLDSAIKHEPARQLYVAGWMRESASWQKSVLTSFKKLGAHDFEIRNIDLIVPSGAHWDKLSSEYVAKRKHNILNFKETGSVVMLPVQDEIDGMALAMTVLALRSINDIRAASTYFKLHQVRPDFGEVVAGAIRDEAYTQASLAGQPLPWRLIHNYFALHESAYNPEIFEPHVQPEDLVESPVEDHLARLHSMFEFWQGTSHVGFLHNKNVVSMNVLDVALNFCNKIPYEERIVKYFRYHLGHELLLSYLHEQHLSELLQQQLADELVGTEIA